ncbi:hypothetical protein BGZ83_004478 [Gryganskiella cystojenkinii]|nr:hypothetical protein BGZ83_004478 [Gryganskiella cystojenkinii]
MALTMCFVSILNKEKWSRLRKAYVSESDTGMLEGLGRGSMSVVFRFGLMRKTKHLAFLLIGAVMLLVAKMFSKAIVGSFEVTSVIQSNTVDISWFDPQYFATDFSGNARDLYGLSKMMNRVSSAFFYPKQSSITNSTWSNISFQALPQSYDGSLLVSNVTAYMVDVQCAFFVHDDLLYDAAYNSRDDTGDSIFNITNQAIVAINPAAELRIADGGLSFSHPRVLSYRNQQTSDTGYDLFYFSNASYFNKTISIPPTFTFRNDELLDIFLYVVGCVTHSYRAKVTLNYTSQNSATVVQQESERVAASYNDGVNMILQYMDSFNVGFEKPGSDFINTLLVGEGGNENNTINDLPQRMERDITRIKTQFVSGCMSQDDGFVPTRVQGVLHQPVFAIGANLILLTACVVVQSMMLIAIVVFVAKNRTKAFPAVDGIISSARLCRDSNIYDVLNEIEADSVEADSGEARSSSNDTSSMATLMVKSGAELSVRLEGAVLKARALSPPSADIEMQVSDISSLRTQVSKKMTLVVGSANGDLKNLCAKVGTINSKHGPFDILFCTGNFFAKETPIETIDELMENKLDFPIATYFIHGDHGVPGIVERRAARNGGEVCNNLFYLESHGVMTTSQSVKVASLSGSYDSAVYEANVEDEEFDTSLLRNHYTKSQVDGLIKSTEKTTIMDTSKLGVDIFLSHEWPAGILEKVGPSVPGSAVSTPVGQEASTFSHVVSRATAHLQPRYHFAARSGQFWERPPYKNTQGAEHATRFIGLGEVGNKNKQRWFYAFNIVPLANASDEILAATMNAVTTASPLAALADMATQKRSRHELDGESFFWDQKRARNEPPSGYICRRCNVPGHFIKDCPTQTQNSNGGDSQGNGPRPIPEGYICNKCQQPGHMIRDCPLIKEEERNRPQRQEYICRICNKPGHKIQDCPEKESSRSGTSSSSLRPSRPALDPNAPPPPCWFCLSNPEIDKNLIVSIGTEVYMTLAKGQMPDTTAGKALIPGGGHVILITINHYSSFSTVEEAAKSDLESELRQYKDGLRNLYKSKGAAMVVWELSQRGAMQHAHTQVMAIPQDKVEAVETAFRDQIGLFYSSPPSLNHKGKALKPLSSLSEDPEGPDAVMEEEEDPESSQPKAEWQTTAPSDGSNYFKVELPNGKNLYCIIPMGQRIDMQFGRNVLAKALGTPDRAFWKKCVKSPEEERKDGVAFKDVFKKFDFTM